MVRSYRELREAIDKKDRGLREKVVSMHHERKRFVERVDFITSPGYLQGGDSREKAGLTEGGVYKVITHLGILGFDEGSRRMRLEALHPGAGVEEVRERTGFELIVPGDLPYTEPPTEEELRIVRELDPEQRYTRPRED